MPSISTFQNKENGTVKVIDDLLNQVLGENATQVFYKYLEKNYSIQKHEIVKKLDSFDMALKDSFGAAAGVLENLIIQNLDSSFPA